VTIEAVPCPHPGCVDLRDVRYPDDEVLHLTTAEWVEFLAAVKRGDFDTVTGRSPGPSGSTA
jgi:hypothetical protein